MTRAEKIKVLKGYVSADEKLKGIIVRMDNAKAKTEEQIEMLKGMLILPSSSGDGTGIRGGGGGDKFASVYAAIDELERKYAKMTADAADAILLLNDQKRTVTDAIDKIADGQYAKVLTYRYVMDMRWYDIAQIMSISESYARGILHNAALDALEI